MCIHICLARSLHEKSHINVYLQTRLMIYVLVQCNYSVLLKYQYILMFVISTLFIQIIYSQILLGNAN